MTYLAIIHVKGTATFQRNRLGRRFAELDIEFCENSGIDGVNFGVDHAGVFLALYLLNQRRKPVNQFVLFALRCRALDQSLITA